MIRLRCGKVAATSALMVCNGTARPHGASKTVSPESAPSWVAAAVLTSDMGSALSMRTRTARV
eukprot:1210785-Alexandrium_andersonii.AAC.1